MASFFEKIMLARQALFNDGNIQLFGLRYALVTEYFFNMLTEKINDNPRLSKLLYADAKRAAYNFALKVGSSRSYSADDYLKWAIEIEEFAGWGVLKWEELDAKAMRGTLTASDSATGGYLKGKADAPCDHVIRGLMAGNASCAFKSDVDLVETECIALGKSKCRFEMGSPSALMAEYKELYDRQV